MLFMHPYNQEAQGLRSHGRRLTILGNPPVAFLLGPLLAVLLRSLVGVSWAQVGYVLFRRAGDSSSIPNV